MAARAQQNAASMSPQVASALPSSAAGNQTRPCAVHCSGVAATACTSVAPAAALGAVCSASSVDVAARYRPLPVEPVVEVELLPAVAVGGGSCVERWPV